MAGSSPGHTYSRENVPWSGYCINPWMKQFCELFFNSHMRLHCDSKVVLLTFETSKYDVLPSQNHFVGFHTWKVTIPLQGARSYTLITLSYNRYKIPLSMFQSALSTSYGKASFRHFFSFAWTVYLCGLSHCSSDVTHVSHTEEKFCDHLHLNNCSVLVLLFQSRSH